ncbi:MAG: hypothetical protein QOH61_2599 [Chloroflexota bacterium]|jgi:kumamolisin|nr:hypothetical protein [Chloroflexota bacterium]
MSARRPSGRRAAVIAGVAAVAIVATSVLAVRPWAAPSPARSGLAGQAAAPADAGSASGHATTPVDADTPITVGLLLRMPGEAEIQPYLNAIADPASPDYARYLDPAAFGRRFGPSDSAIERAVRWVTAHGLRVAPVEPQRTVLLASGTGADLERLFDVTLSQETDATGRSYRVPSAAPRIPGEIADIVEGVTGLADAIVARPAVVPPFADVLNGFMMPADLRKAYDIDRLTSAGYTGDGQSAVIVSFDTSLDADVVAWDERTGTVNGGTVTRVPIEGGVAAPGEGSVEVNLDIQTIRAIAPQADVYDYEGPWSGQTWLTMMSQIVSDGFADVVSISWGICEPFSQRGLLSSDGQLLRSAVDREIAAASAAGITIYVASGDWGIYDCNRGGSTAASVDWPSANPNLMSVGGTFLSVRQDGTYHSESAWEGAASSWATGGGVSTDYDRPVWQQGLGIDPATIRRLVPDIAGPADPEAGLLIRSSTPAGSFPWSAGGGTSQAAPFWAGLTVLVRQLAEEQGVLRTIDGRQRLGFLGPVLYELAASPEGPGLFHDILAGGNLGESAATGWDTSTGLGSPVVTPLAQAIVEYLRTHPQTTP